MLVQPAFQKDAALLADVEAARARGLRRLWWLGQSGFLLQSGGTRVLFDPYLSDSLTRKYEHTDKPHVRITERVIDPGALAGIRLITSSHAHTDHFDPDTLGPLLERNRDAQLLVARANHENARDRLPDFAERMVAIDAGESIRVGQVTVAAVPAAHEEVERDSLGCCRFLGFVLSVDGLTMYHSGDTRLYDGLAAALEPFRPDVVLVPINGSKPERRVAGNMDGREAAWLARTVGARLAIPHHFDMFAFNTEPPAAFEAECRRLGQAFRTLRNGEGLDLEFVVRSP
jgi:L-ascorbate metabolism protein UlaG (beta-lactamase superfamily)